MSKTKIILLIFLCSLSSCRFFSRQQRAADAVAEVNGQYLSASELDQITYGLNTEDSARIAEAYIRNWAIRILEYDKAKEAASDALKELVKDYERTLYVHEYEQQLIARRMSKQVADSVIERFYKAHTDRFVLQDHIVKGALIVLPIDAPKQDKVKKQLLALGEKDNLEQVEKYAFQYASGYELFLDEWKSGSQILLRLPLQTDILQQRLNSNRLIEVQDSLSTYILVVTDKHLKGDIMPLDYATPEIKQIILSQRQVTFLEDEKQGLYNNAVLLRKVKIYDKKK